MAMVDVDGSRPRRATAVTVALFTCRDGDDAERRAA